MQTLLECQPRGHLGTRETRAASPAWESSDPGKPSLTGILHLKRRHVWRQTCQVCEGLSHLDTHVFPLSLAPPGVFGEGKGHVFPTRHSHSGRGRVNIPA